MVYRSIALRGVRSGDESELGWQYVRGLVAVVDSAVHVGHRAERDHRRIRVHGRRQYVELKCRVGCALPCDRFVCSRQTGRTLLLRQLYWNRKGSTCNRACGLCCDGRVVPRRLRSCAQIATMGGQEGSVTDTIS
jgi:hypothetical protein